MAEIIKNPPPPPPRGSVRQKYPFHKMEKGDAIRIDETEQRFRQIIPLMYQLKKVTGARFTSHWYGDYGMVWRIE